MDRGAADKAVPLSAQHDLIRTSYAARRRFQQERRGGTGHGVERRRARAVPRPAYGEVSPDGQDHFKVVATKIGEMIAVEPNLRASDLATVTRRTLVMFSVDDLMTMTHAVETYEALPNAEFAVVPGTSHFLTQEKPHS